MQYQESNLLGQTTRQWGSQTNPVSFTYDSAGNRATMTTYRADVGANADTFPSVTGDTTTWVHDPCGVLLEKIYPDTKKTTYTYDIAGRLTTRTWARGVVTTYGYIAGQLTSTTYTNDPANTPAVSMAYDRLGRQVSQSNGLATTDYGYDSGTLALDTETVTIDPDGSGPLPALTRILDRSRDNLGREGSAGILPVSNGSAEHFLTYGYDASGRLSSVTSPVGTFTYAYTPNSSLIASVTGPVHTVTNFWETHRNVLDIKENKIPSTNTTISSFNYGVNQIGQRTGVTTTGSAFPSQPADWVWGYDALGQVISADSPDNNHDRAYEYDAIGNRRKSEDSLTLPTTDNYTANPLNQYSETRDREVNGYDLDGNLVRWANDIYESGREGQKLYYDGENRLTLVERWHNDNETELAVYVYDGQSRRVARISESGTAATLYLYDGWNCIAEYTLQNSSFSLHTSNTWGLDLSGSLQGAGGVGGLLAVTRHEAQSTTHFYPTYDGNGNISEYLTATGSIAAHFEYDPFGRVIVATGSQAADFAYRFSTKPVDSATGLYYYGYRWYDPDTGRWVNRDPIEEEGGVNLYGFVGNSSNNSVDAWGLQRYYFIVVSPETLKKCGGEYPEKWRRVGSDDEYQTAKWDLLGNDFDTTRILANQTVLPPWGRAPYAYDSYTTPEKNWIEREVYACCDVDGQKVKLLIGYQLWDNVDEFYYDISWDSYWRGIGGQATQALVTTAGTLTVGVRPNPQTTAAPFVSGGREYTRSVELTREQAAKIFMKEGHLGIPGRWNESMRAVVNATVNKHLNNPGTRLIHGTYRGKPVQHFLDPQSGLNVFVNPNGSFGGLWKLNAEQTQSVLTTGRLF